MHLFITASPIFRSLPNRQSPDFVTRNRGSFIACTETSRRRLVADVHLAEAGNPSPAARSDHHKASSIAIAPVAVMAPVIATTHSTTTLTPPTSGSFGRDKRGCADGGRGGDSENRLANHESLLWLSLDVLLTSCPLVVRMIRRVQLHPQKATLCDCHHIASTNVGAKSRPCRRIACAALHLGEQRSELCVATNGLPHWRWWFCSRCHQQPGTPRA